MLKRKKEKPFIRKQSKGERRAHLAMGLWDATAPVRGLARTAGAIRAQKKGRWPKWAQEPKWQERINNPDRRGPIHRQLSGYITGGISSHLKHRAIDYAFDPKGAWKEGKTRKNLKKAGEFAFKVSPFGFAERAVDKFPVSNKTKARMKKINRGAAKAGLTFGLGLVGYGLARNPMQPGVRLAAKQAAYKAKQYATNSKTIANAGIRGARMAADAVSRKYSTLRGKKSRVESGKWQERFKKAKQVVGKKTATVTYGNNKLARYRNR